MEVVVGNENRVQEYASPVVGDFAYVTTRRPVLWMGRRLTDAGRRRRQEEPDDVRG